MQPTMYELPDFSGAHLVVDEEVVTKRLVAKEDRSRLNQEEQSPYKGD